ncbi:MAG: chemotaxis protein CheX [Terriglobales bacterium]
MKSANETLGDHTSHQNWLPLLEVATREVFELMLGSHLAVSTTAEEPSSEVTSMVGLAGQLCGVLSLRCDGKAASLMTSKMLGVPAENAGPEMSDALGEICNMVAGNFKNKITGLGDGCMLSPPTVICGNDYSLYSQTDEPNLQVRLLFENMPILISLQIQN